LRRGANIARPGRRTRAALSSRRGHLTMKRIAIGGWQHETNTFAPFETDYRAFEMADGWPALAEGPAIIEAVAGINMPIEGFIQTAKRAAVLVPTLWTSAEPAGYVTGDAFERIAGRLCGAIRAAAPLD